MKTFLFELSEELGATPVLTAAYVIVTFLVLVMAVVYLALEIRVWLRYRKANRTPISCNMTGIDAARLVLEKEGLAHIRVRKAGLLREAVFGNYYNVLTKTIYLRSWLGKIDQKKSVTSVALGVQKAALAKLCEEGDQKTLLRNRLSLIAIFGPLLFLPVLIAGVVLDFVLLDRMGPFSLAGLVLSGLLAVCGLVVTLLNIPVEKQANRLALEMMERFGLASGAELETMRGVYDAYIVAYVAQFLLQMLRMIQWVLEIVIKLQQKEK